MTIRRSARSTADRSPRERPSGSRGCTPCRQAGRWAGRRRREPPPVGSSLSGEGPGARSPAREGARHRGSDAFGRRVREGDLPRYARKGRHPKRDAARLSIPGQAASRQRLADEAIRVLRKGPQGTALVAAPGRGPYRRPRGRYEVKSPRHLQLRWRPSDSSDGGERVARVPLWRLGRPGRSAGCQRRRLDTLGPGNQA